MSLRESVEEIRLGKDRGRLLLQQNKKRRETMGKNVTGVYDVQIKFEVKRIHIDGCRYNERLHSKTEGSKRLVYTGLIG